ncbi:MAG: hypothetical protein Q4P25_01895 [Tissierellia bacterium]|nr:hypothetical protein [Tissierellia bacterium]
MIDTNRLNNISWTVAEDYSPQWDEILFPNLDRYTAALRGFLHRSFQMELFQDFFQEYVLKLNNRQELLAIARVLFDFLTKEDLLSLRPGVRYFRQKHIETFLETLKHGKITLSLEIEQAYYQLEQGKIPRASQTTRQLLDDIFAFDEKDSYRVLTFLQFLYDKYFHLEEYLPPDKKIRYREAKKKPGEILSKKAKSTTRFLEEEDLEKYTIGSAEFTELYQEEEGQRLPEEESKAVTFPDQDIYQIAKKHYGIEKIPRHHVMALERELATGIHEGIHFYFASGEFSDKNSYFSQRIQDNYEENINYYNENFLLYERGIRKLMEIIKNSLLQDNEDEILRSDTGKIVPKDLWKYIYLGERRVFEKVQKFDSKDLYVDILLDSSASQEERKKDIATEGYIIASALTRLKIKTRVWGFNNFYNYLILRKYRDYNDSQIKNTEIFKYTPSGSNRDGLAIRLIRHLMESSRDQRRILIILSDGKPNDEIHLNIVGSRNLEGQDYTDDTAILDSAREVLFTRLRDINLFGVFTGESEDISKVKKIYGTDFAYITDISRFHEVVGIFLKTFAPKIQ